MTNEECVREARSVTLFIHGVGAQECNDMSGAAEQGFWRARRRPDDRTQLLNKIGLGPGRVTTSAFSIITGGTSHVIVPLVWCNIRGRIRQTGTKGARPWSLEDIPGGNLLSWVDVLPRLLDVCADVRSCAS